MSSAAVRCGLPLIAFGLLAALGAGCAERPAVCDPKLRDRIAEQDKRGTLALAARKDARALVERALAAADAQGERFAVMRNYDDATALCTDATRALVHADAELAKAELHQRRISEREGEAERTIASLDSRLVLARGLADTGAVDPTTDAMLRKVVQTGVDVKRDLDRARAEQRGAGFVLDLAPFMSAADRAVRVVDDVRSATLAITEQITARCRLRIDPVALAEARLRSHADWIVLEVPGLDRSRMLVLKVDREKRACSAIYDRPASPGGITDLEGSLLTWSIPGVVPHRLLVSFGRTSAWFLEGARFFKFPHERAAGFPKACAGRVTCDKPRTTRRTVEADCACAAPVGSRLLPSEVAKTGRYAWDGSRVVAEP